jgi:hypothetical protein
MADRNTHIIDTIAGYTIIFFDVGKVIDKPFPIQKIIYTFAKIVKN